MERSKASSAEIAARLRAIAGGIRQPLKLLGPGLITGAADDDPSGIGTFSQTGAQFGYEQLRVPLFTIPFMVVLQAMSARIGMITGMGPARVMRSHYGRPILIMAVTLLVVANTFNIGVDLGAMADAARLIWPFAFPLWLIALTTLSLMLEIFLKYSTYAKFLKYLTLSLFAYVITGCAVRQNWMQVLHNTFVPTISLSRDYLMNLVAVFGATISPYVMFWQADEEVEEDVAQHRVSGSGEETPRITPRNIREMRIDVWSGMTFANLVSFFIILTAAATLSAHGIKNVQTAGLAARALRPIAGRFASVVFTSGIVGTGLLAVPVLAGSASYAVAGALNWRSGLYRKAAQARGFYGVMTVSTFIGVLIQFTSVSPFKMLYYSAVLNGLLAPPLIVLFVRMSSDPSVVGSHTNSRISNVMGWLIVIITMMAAIALIVSWLRPI